MISITHGIHILLLCPDEKDATSFYRGWGPFSDLAYTSEIPVFLHRATNVSWSTLKNMNLVILQRPCLENHVKILEMARTVQQLLPPHTLRIWIDWDDLLWQVPRDNPTWSFYSDTNAIKQIMCRCVTLADIVTVSTEALKHAFPQELQPKITVLQNRLPGYWPNNTKMKKVDGTIWIAWRGSRTHEADWIDFLDAACTISLREQIGWRILGHPSPWVLERLAQSAEVYHKTEASIEKYFTNFILNGPQAHILFVPLRDHAFNRAKSHIALLEAAFGGMLCVGPRWEEWETGISEADRLLYASPDNAKDCLLRACEQARKGSFSLLNRLQDHFRKQTDEVNQLFQQLVFQEYDKIYKK